MSKSASALRRWGAGRPRRRETAMSIDPTPPAPEVVDRTTWQAAIDELRIREKAHTHEGDAIAAARRHLPMVEIDPTIPVVGANGPVPLLDVFEGRSQLIAYYS